MSEIKEYGYNKSVMEAIEELGIACMMNGMKPPKAMIFDKESLAKLTAQFKPQEKFKLETQEEANSRIELVTTSAGDIKIEEEK